MEVRALTAAERPKALELALAVFMEFEAPEYSAQGVAAFCRYLESPAAEALLLYGAFLDGGLRGTLAVQGEHISWFFADPAYHRQGLGRVLFRAFLRDTGVRTATVHSSPYAVAVYRRLGFRETGPERTEDGIRYTPMRWDAP